MNMTLRIKTKYRPVLSESKDVDGVVGGWTLLALNWSPSQRGSCSAPFLALFFEMGLLDSLLLKGHCALTVPGGVAWPNYQEKRFA